MNSIYKNADYLKWLQEVKEKLRSSQLKAAIAVNSALLKFYWQLGADIVEKQKNAKWGSKFLDQLSRDLTAEFPEMKGFSLRNLKYIRQWQQFYAQSEIGQQAVAQLFQVPWGHHLAIIAKCKNAQEGFFYIQKTIENNWSRNVLLHQIESGLHRRQSKAITNFSKTLPAPQSDLAHQIIKDPYNFDFLTLTQQHNERELEQGLIQHITKFLLELGTGFAYVGKQVLLSVGQREFYLDLLFYHTRLHAYVVIELKTGDFEPEHAGKLNFYIKAVDEKLRQKEDQPTIGILLCKRKDKLVAEYALSDIHKPMGVSEYRLTQALPKNLKSSLPAIEKFEAEFGDGGKR